MAFWDQITQLFRRAAASGPAAPTVHELIVRSPAERADYERWAATAASQRMLTWLGDAYANFLAGRRGDDTTDFLDTPSSKGFVLHLHRTNYDRAECTHFFDFLHRRILDLGYRPQISDRRIFPRNHWIETQERHYLKPRHPVRADYRNLDQRYGNITLELELRDDRPRNLRLRATVYADANYRPAQPFAALVEALLNQP